MKKKKATGGGQSTATLSMGLVAGLSFWGIHPIFNLFGQVWLPGVRLK